MAEDTYSLKFTAVNQDDWALNGAGKTADLIPPDASAWSQPSASGADQQMLGLNEAFAGLGLALAGASLQIGSLSAEQGRLTAVLESINTTLTSQRSLLQAMNDMPAPASRSGAGAEQKSQSTGSDNPPYEPLKPAINLDAAMVDLGLVIHFEGDQRRALAITNEKMATEALVAPSKATAIDLAGVEYTAAKAGIGNEQRDSQGNVDTVARQGAIVEFTRDAAITASAFKLPVQETAELLIGWRTSMNLDRLQTQDLADATSVLASNMSASEADIGSILSNYGAAGTNAGLAPEQAAAFSTALLNAGVKPTDAGVAFEKITTTLARGSATTPGQQAAWAQLGLDPKALASGMQTNAPATLQSVLEALKRQPVAERAGLATQLFSVDRPVLQLLQNLSEVERAFSLVSKKENYTNSEQHQHSAVQQAALTRSTSSQAHWNVFNAQLDRLKTSSGDTVLPLFNQLLVPVGAVMNGLSSFAEAFPVATGALILGAASVKGAKVFNTVKDWLGNASGDSSGKGNAGGPKTGGLGSRLLTRAAALRSSAVSWLQAAPDAVWANVKSVGSAASSRMAFLTSGAGRAMIGRAARVGRVAGPLAMPMMLANAGIDVVEGVRTGDAKLVGSGLGSAAGGLAGSYAGAAAGAAIGTFIFPGLGTVVGGLLGGVLGGMAGSEAGSEAGSWLGEKLAAPADCLGPSDHVSKSLSGAQSSHWLGEKLAAPANRLGTPDQMSTNLTNAQANNRQINFAPVIHITDQDPTQARQIANLVTQTIQAQFVPMLLGNPLAVRRSAALTDGGV